MHSRRITSYNILSSHLSDPSYFTHCNSSYLNPNYRFQLICKKLDRETALNSIICLQEVSIQWAGMFHAYFSSRQYHFITALYGGKHSGYMGVAIAVPLHAYDLINVDITRIADTKKMLSTPIQSFIWKLFNPIMSFIGNLIGLKSNPSPWEVSQDRKNQMICAQVKCKDSGESFFVGNYHMPCVFKIPQVMTIHCSLAAQHLQRLAGSSPYILAGDFNIKPTSTMYQLLTQGQAEVNSTGKNPDVPDVLPGDSWRAEVQPMRSAYMEATGKEPDFTNNARIRDDEPFIDTLDYIFLSDQWSVKSVEQLPHRDNIQGPLPNGTEPSDHILIATDLVLDAQKD